MDSNYELADNTPYIIVKSTRLDALQTEVSKILRNSYYAPLGNIVVDRSPNTGYVEYIQVVGLYTYAHGNS